MSSPTAAAAIAPDPEAWRAVADTLLAPLAWIPVLQRSLVGFLLDPRDGWIVTVRVVLLAIPMILLVGALWCTMAAIYTVPFRARRKEFAATLAVAWWDAARASWSYWVGLVRIAALIVGWGLTLLRLGVHLAFELLRRLTLFPVVALRRAGRDYFRPGLPWVALALLLGWCMLEASIFTYVLYPTVSDLLEDLVGVRAPASTGPVLYLFLLFLILGSFTCLQALLGAVRNRRLDLVAQMAAVVFFVVGFEVLFLYRAFVEAIAPWITARTGDNLGVVAVTALAIGGWIGIRGMTWFLFGRFGTPPLVAVVSRTPPESHPPSVPARGSEERLPDLTRPIREIPEETEWLRGRAEELGAALTLPVMQALAALLNFATIVLTARPVFDLPLGSVREILNTTEILAVVRSTANASNEPAARSDVDSSTNPGRRAITAPLGRVQPWTADLEASSE